MRPLLHIPPSGSRRRVSPGFTLVELLITMGIIAVLVALFYPALMRAQERSRTAVCLSNLRQIGTGIVGYATDHNQELPGNNDRDPWRWYLHLLPYTGKGVNDQGRPSIFICPANDRKTTFTKSALFFDVSYWGNLFLMPRMSTEADGSTKWGNGRGRVRLNQLPPERVLGADNPMKTGSQSYMMHFRSATEAQNNRPYPPGPDGDIHSMARIHGGGVNALFTDFSVRFMMAEEINRPGREIETGAYFGGLQ